ncbi:MAG: hypothetical protein DRJ42_10400 [Deltaproteobacteria bacterium]|nr:MAG: hypothetical protein DRJ42_10400 [Deltaproteobacteria bacterium]
MLRFGKTLQALLVLGGALGAVGVTGVAHAFCGFYVSGADASLYANATMVVMMRDGNHTVLSMQNNYQGPPEDFAMVVPVPVVLQEDNVQTLPREIFDRVDSLAAPRLVEYWETDPCQPPAPPMGIRMRAMPMAAMAEGASGAGDLGVTVEAEFSVAEYDIVILSARDSDGLDTWLRQQHYNIPEGAEPVLRPYVEAGTKFFVAKVDAERVTFVDGRAVLSPLRFDYDAAEFSLPVRLGLLNSGGQQDLLVHILARGQRYEVANYENATIPTNLVVKDETRWGFGEFYDLIFRRTVAHNPRSVVTEYSWDASSCDPCPVPALDAQEITTLGADVLQGQAYGFVLTRLHYRYGPDGLGEDLVFRAAPPIVGGRGTPNADGAFAEEGAEAGSYNNFQGRYGILHPWEGEISCAEPLRGRWGGPPGQPMPVWGAPNPLLRGEGAGEAVGAPERPAGLAAVSSIGMLVAEDIPAIGVVAGRSEAVHTNDPGPAGGAPPAAAVLPGSGSGSGGGRDAPPAARSDGGCASCAVSGPGGGATAFLAFALLALSLGWRRFRR